MIYRLHHATIYDYAEPVVLGTHFMHLLPRACRGQSIRESYLDISPAPDSRRDEIDYFGNHTTTLSIASAHKQFSVRLSATIDVSHAPPPLPERTMAWEQIAAQAIYDPLCAEYCLGSALAEPVPAIKDYAAISFPAGQPILVGLLDLNYRLWTDLTYRPGVSNTATTAAHTLKLRAGVCQDYTHLMLACLRALRLPARYISGYLRTAPPAGQAKRRGADQSHAWVSAWLGSEAGWVDLDPTNNLIVTDEHVTLAWGRDFQDVSPLRGIILGGGRHALQVNVDLDPVLT